MRRRSVITAVSSVVRDRVMFKLLLARKRIRKRKSVIVGECLEADKLRQSPLFKDWTTRALEDVCKEMVLEVFQEGEVIAYGEEPRGISSLFWVVSGNLTEVPAKHEGYRATSLPLCTSGDQAKDSKCRSVEERFTTGSTPSDLTYFKAGKLVAGERLFLGINYRRTIRCESVVKAFRVRLSTVMRIQKKWSAPIEQALSYAKTVVQKQMTEGSEKLTPDAVLRQNPLLNGLTESTINVLWIALSPSVFCTNELLCADVFKSENIFFLYSGCVKVKCGSSGAEKIIARHGSAVALHSFIPSELPPLTSGGQPAIAAKVSLLWSLSREALERIVCLEEWRACAGLACRLMRFAVDPLVLSRVHSLTRFSDAKLVVFAKRLRPRMFRCGECILPIGAVPQEGMLIIQGTACLTRGGAKKGHQPMAKTEREIVPPGYSVGFEECILGKSMTRGLIAETDVFVLTLERSIVIDAMKKNGNDRGSSEKGVSMSHNSSPLFSCSNSSSALRGQTGIVDRIKSENELKDSFTSVKVPSFMPITADLDTDHLLKYNTKVLSALALKMSDMNPNSVNSRRDLLSCDTASMSVFKKPGRGISKALYRTKSCFSVDDFGNVVYYENGIDPANRQAHSGSPLTCGKNEAVNKYLNPGMVQIIQTACADAASNVVKHAPKTCELRCEPTTTHNTVVSQCPASHRVLALRREMKKMEQRAERASDLPFTLFVGRAKV
ncbi:hypothetical protein ERJ75_000745200 [Trypanosoma vivax]|uniref:Cyclic nucleotide-binding domain-containing protein n=1 Tax=Trypanosoma vivax (strain Y486) TaxID=1055687 RepID=G0TYU2_TRYVY|nr:hypothetical protein ERJ75_000745200 [Trypanosoma vivax]CCC49142.1 conserved hypothetical protein [Trypanosoma vivax Y486]